MDLSRNTFFVLMSIFQFLDDYGFGVLNQGNALRSVPACFHNHPRAVYLSGLSIDPRSMQSIAYIVTICYASTSLPSLRSSLVAFITRSKSSSRSAAASSGYASPWLL
jgi:hypothetical protein